MTQPVHRDVPQQVRTDTMQNVRQDIRQDVRTGYYPRPVYGTRVRTLPSYARRAHLGGRAFFYWGSAYYIWNESDQEYVCVETPIGGYVEELPGDCDSIVIDENEYYLCGGEYYQRVYYENAVWYTRVDTP